MLQKEEGSATWTLQTHTVPSIQCIPFPTELPALLSHKCETNIKICFEVTVSTHQLHNRFSRQQNRNSHSFQINFLTMSLEDGCAPRGWSCQEGRGGSRLKGQCWGHWGGAKGDYLGALLAETEDHHPRVEALILGCIWCLPQWSSTGAKKNTV